MRRHFPGAETWPRTLPKSLARPAGCCRTAAIFRRRHCSRHPGYRAAAGVNPAGMTYRSECSRYQATARCPIQPVRRASNIFHGPEGVARCWSRYLPQVRELQTRSLHQSHPAGASIRPDQITRGKAAIACSPQKSFPHKYHYAVAPD